ncbi:unnamed protein product [Calicophoron daubneyi]|uniref:Thioredoxin domain-containing protein n=1 Tax=Calicophoron daubneyi TaxID=300641 RepID=A0AAV2TET0_CALDB
MDLRFFGFLLVFPLFFLNGSSVVTPITDQNFTAINSYRVVLLQFSADWCHFSRLLSPIYSEASDNFSDPVNASLVLFARIDCSAEADLCAREGIRKYPTIKVVKYGVTMKREYRGARTVPAFVSFVVEHLKDNITILNGNGVNVSMALQMASDSRNTIMGLFPELNENNSHIQHFRKVGLLERENCAFYLIHNLSDKGDRLAYSEALTNRIQEITHLNSADFLAIQRWISLRCQAVVRELTFANAEEITDEGRPLLLLFYDPKSAHLKKRFHDIVKTHLVEERKQINFLTADGIEFSHPLVHLGKTATDLPLICIDSLVHMYLHPLPVEEILKDPKTLKQFVEDLNSGKLHREFHYGRETTTKKPQVTEQSKTPPKFPVKVEEHQTDPPESVFKDLSPSHLRYTILHDEF